MTTIKDILNLFFSQWKPGIQVKYIELCDKLSPEDKTNHLDSLNILAVLFKIQGIQMVALNLLYEKYNLQRDDFLNQLPQNVLLHFWESVSSYILLHPQISLLLNNLTPILAFENSYKIFPHIIALSNSYLIKEFISRQNEQSIMDSIGYLFSSNNTELISKIFPFFLNKEPNLIALCIQPELKEEVVATSLSSNFIGKISLLNLAYLLIYLKNGKIKQDSQLFKALTIYIKRFFIHDLDIEAVSTSSLFDSVILKYPDLKNEKPFTDHIIQTIEQAKIIVENHQVNQIESFVNDLIGSGNCDDFNKHIAAATISGLIITYVIDTNLLIKLILLLKQIGVIEFPDFLTLRLLRKNPSLVEKISSFHPIPSIAQTFLKGELHPKIEELCSDKPYQIIKALYIIATFDQDRKQIYNFPPAFHSYIEKIDFQNMKIPKGAPEYIKKYKFDGSAACIDSFYLKAFQDKNLTYKYFEIEENFISRLVKIAKQHYPDFTYDNKSRNNFPHKIDSPLSDEYLFMTVADIALPEGSFNSCLTKSFYNDPEFNSTMTSIANDNELDEYANLLISTIGGI